MAILKKLAFLLVLSLSANVFAEQVSSTKFRGLNNNENSVIIDPSDAQDLQNIDVSPGGLSIKKRSGYGLYKALATTKPILGLYHFFDSTGNDVQVAGSSTSLYGIVAGGTPTQLISSATLSSIWDCADSQGSAYCVNSNRNAYVKTNGATMTWYSAPLGTMVETTPDRVVVAGVSGFPNTIYVSESNTFTNFTVGIDATSPFNEVIASQGSKLTHLRYGCGNLLWWKDQSFGVMAFDDQFNVQIRTVSDTIGTFDNTSAIDPGGNVWFRGQDGHTWKYDCSFLTKESIDISPNTQVTGSRVSNLWSQTTQSDFATGISTPVLNVSTVSSSGDVVFNGIVSTETSSAQWNLGTASNLTIGSSSITLPTNNSGTINDPSFEGTLSTNYTGASYSFLTSISAIGCTVNPQSGSQFASINKSFVAVNKVFANFVDATTGVCLSTATITPTSSCGGWTQATIPSSGLIGRRAKVKFCPSNNSTSCDASGDLITNSSFIIGGDVSFYHRYDQSSGPASRLSFDNVSGGSSTIVTGSFTSQELDLGFPSSLVQLSTFNWTANTSTPSFSLISGAVSGGPYTTVTSSSNTWATANRYVRYTTTITVTSSDNALTAITAAIISRSTGTYYSSVHNAPNITSWSTLGVNSVSNGGVHSFYVRAGTNTFSTLSSTPTWTAATAGGLIPVSTGTYMQFRDDFSITYSTQTPTINEFTFNWFEGSSSDQSYMLYFDNAIWQSVGFGAAQTTNNYIFKKDLINDAWTVYNFGAGGLAVQANRLYFGDTSAGNVYIYGSATSDNGSAINAYWKGKDFTGQDPFLQNQLNKIDVFCKKDQGSTLTGTYTTDTSTATAYSISLSTSASIVQHRKILPSGKLGYTMNYKLSDSSTSSAWECFGYRMDYTPLPYRPTYP